ncbi:MAG TPA: mechanosensitive ion channel protein, partial [Duganella sp.]
MSKQQPLFNLIEDLSGDLRDPSMLWQIAALVVSAILGWTLARLLRKYFGRNENHGDIMRFGVESVGRVVPPMLVVGLLVL